MALLSSPAVARAAHENLSSRQLLELARIARGLSPQALDLLGEHTDLDPCAFNGTNLDCASFLHVQTDQTLLLSQEDRGAVQCLAMHACTLRRSVGRKKQITRDWVTLAVLVSVSCRALD